MTTKDFANKLRSKYPDGTTKDNKKYADLSDDELVGLVVQKYPKYQKQLTDFQTEEKGFFGRAKDWVKNQFSEDKGLLETEKQIIQERGQAGREQFVRADKGEISKVKALFRSIGQGGGAVGDIVGAGIKFLAPKFLEEAGADIVGQVADTEIAQKAISKYEELKKKHPEAMMDLEAFINIADVLPVGKVASIGGEQLLKATSRNVANIAKLTGEALDARRVARITSTLDEIDEVIGKTIVQGTKKGKGAAADARAIANAKKTLSTIDTTGVKTYKELKNTINDGVEALATKVDEVLEQSTEAIGNLKAEDLVTTTKVGDSVVTQNFVTDALDQLDELYDSTKDAPARARIANIKGKLDSEGLSLRDVNDVARQYGSEFGNKAFNKIGDPLTSVNAQAFENTRKGIKNTVRSKMPDDITKMLDERMSEMIGTRELVEKMEMNVTALYRRAKKRGVLEKLSRNIANVADAVTFKTVSGFVGRFLPSNVGLKTMNSIDLEEQLAKNLRKVDDLLKVSNGKKFDDGLENLLKKSELVSKKANARYAPETIGANDIVAEKVIRLDDLKSPTGKKSSYRGSHQLSDVVPVSEVDNLDEVVKEHRKLSGYLTKEDELGLSKIKKMLNNPDKEVKVYRASPLNELNDGDWVTTSKDYAKTISSQNGGKVYSYTIKVKNLMYPTNINDLPSLARFSAFKYKQ